MRTEPQIEPFKDVLLVRVAGDQNLARAVQDQVANGWSLKQITWTGNLEAPSVPAQVLTKDGAPTKMGFISTYVVTFEISVDRPPQVTLMS